MTRPRPSEHESGRLASPPAPELFDLLYRLQFHQDIKDVLPCLLRIDAAHVLMLAEQGILPRDVASGLLRANMDLRERVQRGEEVLEAPAVHRGLYFVYERHLVELLGSEVGGAAHVARSRNDINAAVFRLRLRIALLELLSQGTDLLSVLLSLIREHTSTLMSGFSHFQPAQPTTLGHYLAAVTSELGRSLAKVSASWNDVNHSPLGAGAGQGTSFAIDRERTAALLGFDAVIANSLDAVASRDYAVHVLSPLALLGTSLTRLSLDLQIWSSRAYEFLSWPDELVSTSSMMPQKRNSFVLENIRGQAVWASGALFSTLMGLKNTPFGNTVEVSSEATAHVLPAVMAGGKAIRLTALVLRHARVDAGRMRQFLDREETTMTAVADRLVVRHGLSFRSAHDAVGRLLRRGTPNGGWTSDVVKAGLEEILATSKGIPLILDDEELVHALDPSSCAHAASFGGGPAPESVTRHLAVLEDEHRGLAELTTARRRRLQDAELRLENAIAELVSAKGER